MKNPKSETLLHSSGLKADSTPGLVENSLKSYKSEYKKIDGIFYDTINYCKILCVNVLFNSFMWAECETSSVIGKALRTMLQLHAPLTFKQFFDNFHERRIWYNNGF